MSLWRFLAAAGLTPRKSLTLGALRVPDEHFFDCARGLLDGDGSIANFVHRPTRRAHPDYRYERLVVKFHSASREHIDWLRETVMRIAGLRGYLGTHRAAGRSNPLYSLRYGKHASIALLRAMYREPTSPCLQRAGDLARVLRAPRPGR